MNHFAETFIPEEPDTPHYSSSWWRPFFEGGTDEVMRMLPELVGKAKSQISSAAGQAGPYAPPGGWPKAALLSWPLRVRGMGLGLRLAEDGNRIVSVFPFFVGGLQLTVTLERVLMWDNGVEGQITCSVGPIEVTAYDACYLLNRGWYRKDSLYDFVFCGIAESVAEAHLATMNISADVAEVLKRGNSKHDGKPAELNLKGATILLPAEGCDIDEYTFRGPVKTVSETDLCDQPCWKVTLTVLRDTSRREADQDMDLTLIISRRIWKEPAPPRVGMDLEGVLWLQAHLVRIHGNHF